MIKPKKLILFGLSVFFLICFSSIAIAKADDSYEENDTFNDAYTIALTTYYGTLQISQYDDDWFKVYLNTGHALTVQIDWSSSVYDIELYLYDFNEIVIDSSTGSSNRETINYDCITTDGYYYIKIELINAGTDIPYTLSSSATQGCNVGLPFIPFGNYFLIFAGIAIIGLISFILIKRNKLFKTP
ncbi:MAG: PPC domain-containing protein [Promethearchaeota archaeon]